MAVAAIGSSRRPRRTFYVGLSLLCAVLVFAGFWPTYFGPALVGTFEHPTIIHIHAAVYVGWLLLFIAQAWLAGTGRVALHIKVGNWAIYYGVLVVIVGLMVTFGMFYSRVRADQLAQTQTAFLGIGPILDMFVFAPFFGAAVYYRKVPELHKRLMIVATTSLLIAAVGRMWFWGTPSNPWLVYVLWVSPILIAIGYDFVRHRVVHPVYIVGVAVLALESDVVRRVIHETEAWNAFNSWLARALSG